MYLICIWAGKLVQKTSRLFHNSGAALPGYLTERVYPKFLEVALSRLPDGVIVISGTNGKTTTTKLVAETFEKLGERVMTNRTGSNMTRGIISLVISKSSLMGRLPYDVAVLEVDEAYSAVLAERVPIRASLILNIMRDQLDRFGEIDTTGKYLGRLTKATENVVVLNGDDSRVRQLPTNSRAAVEYFVVESTLHKFIKNEDDWHGKPGTKRAAKAPRAGFRLSKSEQQCLEIKGYGTVNSELEGVHNHLNFTAAFALLSRLKPDIESERLLDLMSTIKPAFGRGERVAIGSSIFDIMLVKNPSSFEQTIFSSKPEKYVDSTVVINDAYADSRDVSWLWDVSVAGLKQSRRIYTGGSRGYDIANRLKYDDIEVEDVLGGEKAIIAKLAEIDGLHAIYCTYTAMLALRKELVRRGHVEQVV